MVLHQISVYKFQFKLCLFFVVAWYQDFLDLCPEKVENYEEKLKNFFREHIHANEEIHYSLEGSGYFDVGGKDDQWIRIWIKEGEIVLQARIYHRFTLDTGNYVKPSWERRRFTLTLSSLVMSTLASRPQLGILSTSLVELISV